MKPLRILLAMMLLLIPVASFGLTPLRMEYFPSSVGSWWKYRRSNSNMDGVDTVKVIKSDRPGLVQIRTRTADPMVFNDYYDIATDGVYLKVSHDTNNPGRNFEFLRTYRPARKILAAPLVPGASWKWKGNIDQLADGGDPSTGEMSQDDTVAGSEIITVPAGKFTCLRVHETRDDGSLGDLWYAPRVGLVKEKWHEGAVRVLLDYRVK